jgi:ActR/RegA family two-component response regulator
MLQTILGFGELALLETPPPDPRASDIQEVIAAANRAKRLTGQLLAFSRNIPMEITRVKLNHELENDQRMLARLLGENIKVVLKLDETLPDILADTGHIEQVLLNLAVNARDAMPDGGTLVLQTSCVTLAANDDRLHPEASPGDYVCWSISDTGCGIPPHIQTKVFDPFFTTKPKDRGTGLGLSTVYGIVRQLNGWILVDSEPGQGTTFAVYFPVANGRAVGETEKAHATSRHAPKDAKILIVEDQEAVALAAERILASRGFETRVAGSVAEALAALEEPGSAYDLVFCDVALGDGNGIELAEKISERNPDMRFLFTSGYVDEKSGWTAIKQRGWKCLVKPCPANELLAAVDEALAHDAEG